MSQSPSGAGWTCKHCTFINKHGHENCDMCGLPEHWGTFTKLLVINKNSLWDKQQERDCDYLYFKSAESLLKIFGRLKSLVQELGKFRTLYIGCQWTCFRRCLCKLRCRGMLGCYSTKMKLRDWEIRLNAERKKGKKLLAWNFDTLRTKASCYNGGYDDSLQYKDAS